VLFGRPIPPPSGPSLSRVSSRWNPGSKLPDQVRRDRDVRPTTTFAKNGVYAAIPICEVWVQKALPLAPGSASGRVDDDRENEHGASDHVFDSRIKGEEIHAVRYRADQQAA
jgi:hypothetical protein